MTLLDVLDLPQLYTKPSAETLLQTLAVFKTAPPSWDRSDVGNGTCNVVSGVKVNPEGVTRYLTSIVSSPLRWIQDEDIKEEIWNQASQRLSERSGRAAMGAMSRSFRIPTCSGSFELSIHEPALTGDDLGLKTWAASYLLAKRLHAFEFAQQDSLNQLQVLELGSGTGLVGLAMAGLGADVVLTDLPSIHANLAHNTQNNSEVIGKNGGSACTGILDWTKPTVCEVFPDPLDHGKRENMTKKFPLILAADSLYSAEHPRLLADTISAWLSEDEHAQVVVEFPYRTAYLSEIKDFRGRMEMLGLHVQEESEEQGFDDWGSAGESRGEDALVTCWWSRWSKRKP